MIKFDRFIFILLCAIMITSCNERYFHLSKINAPAKKGICKLTLINNSPFFVDKEFEKQLKQYGIKQLEKAGYRYSEKYAEKDFMITLNVDSSQQLGNVFLGPSPLAGYYKGYPKAITINLDCIQLKTNHAFWQDEFRAYFFCSYYPDLHRARSLTKYLINQVPDL